MRHARAVRRVVTGHDASGKAIFVKDEWVDPVTVDALPGSEFHQLWSGEAPPSFPDDGTQQPMTTYFPAVGGFRFGQFSVPPESAQPVAGGPDAAADVARG